VDLTSEAYARQLKQLLPGGALWKLEPGSWLSRLLLAIADELARIDGRSEVLLDEWDPRTAVETLADWERVLGLPDGCVELADSVSGRRADVARKLVARGGQTAAYYIDIAAGLGFVATVVETGPHTWRLDVDPGGYELAASNFRVGSRAGDRLSGRSNTVLECVINRAKPAHTLVTFNYL
jgi:uncharacterized protein YmfQ (DUF2313 family)